MKSIVRILHLPSVVQSEFNEATRTLFLCKENKTVTLFNNSSPLVRLVQCSANSAVAPDPFRSTESAPEPAPFREPTEPAPFWEPTESAHETAPLKWWLSAPPWWHPTLLALHWPPVLPAPPWPPALPAPPWHPCLPIPQGPLPLHGPHLSPHTS